MWTVRESSVDLSLFIFTSKLLFRCWTLLWLRAAPLSQAGLSVSHGAQLYIAADGAAWLQPNQSRCDRINMHVVSLEAKTESAVV